MPDAPTGPSAPEGDLLPPGSCPQGHRLRPAANWDLMLPVGGYLRLEPKTLLWRFSPSRFETPSVDLQRVCVECGLRFVVQEPEEGERRS